MAELISEIRDESTSSATEYKIQAYQVSGEGKIEMNLDPEDSSTTGDYSTTEGYLSRATGEAAHAEGSSTLASGVASHSEGFHTQAVKDYQTVIGKYNISDDSSSVEHAFIVGGGSGDTSRSNLASIDWNGNLALSGEVTVNGGTSLEKEGIITVTDARPTVPTSATYQVRIASSGDTGEDGYITFVIGS